MIRHARELRARVRDLFHRFFAVAAKRALLLELVEVDRFDVLDVLEITEVLNRRSLVPEPTAARMVARLRFERVDQARRGLSQPTGLDLGRLRVEELVHAVFGLRSRVLPDPVTGTPMCVPIGRTVSRSVAPT